MKQKKPGLLEAVKKEVAQNRAEAHWKETGKRPVDRTVDRNGNLVLEFELIPHEVDGAIVPQRISDGFVNATAMCKGAGKKFNDWHRLQSTKEFLSELASVAGIPATRFIVTIQGGNPYEQGTWVHPDVAINLGQWCSAKFAVAVARWVREWMEGKTPQSSNLPYHLRRYVANRDQIPPTHWSILGELTIAVIAPLESRGYQLPEHMVPDISEGLMFANWLRKVKKVDPKDFPTYEHRYEDGRVVPARMYPNELLPDFRKHFHEVWIPKKMVAYFKQRDPKALNYIGQTNLLDGETAQKLLVNYA